jgi:hypothetical protein
MLIISNNPAITIEWNQTSPRRKAKLSATYDGVTTTELYSPADIPDDGDVADATIQGWVRELAETIIRRAGLTDHRWVLTELDIDCWIVIRMV